MTTLVDTSVWSLALRRAAIRQELLSGIRDERHDADGATA
jgi:hypothetical protein